MYEGKPDNGKQIKIFHYCILLIEMNSNTILAMIIKMLLIVISSFIFYACISYDVEQIDCTNIDRIEIVNKLEDRAIPSSIILTDHESLLEFCNLMNSRSFAVSFELKRNKGFFDTTVIMKNGKKYNFNTVETVDHGIVITHKMRHFKQTYIHGFIYDQFRKRK